MLKITPFKQSDESRCGPASVKMVLDYYGIKASEDNIAKACNHTFERGCTNEAMRSALQKFGLKATIREDRSFKDIDYWVNSKKTPLIVDWFTSGVNPSLKDLPNGHASVVIGLDKNEIHLLDPENGKLRSIKRDEFYRCWFDWKSTNAIQNFKNMCLRLIIIPQKP